MNELGHVLFQLARAGSAGRRPRMLEATVTGYSDGGTDVMLSGVVVRGLRCRPSTFVPAYGRRVRIEAVATDLTIVGDYDGTDG